MGWSVLLALPLHHDEPADPTLLEWAKGLLDHLFGGGPWLMVVLLGILILALPVGVVLFYWTQHRPAGNGVPGESPENPF